MEFTIKMLRAQYPGLAGFIQSCHDNNEHDKLWDFLLAIETTDFPGVN